MKKEIWISASFNGIKGKAVKDDCRIYDDEWRFVPDNKQDDIEHHHLRQNQKGFILLGEVVDPPKYKYHSNENSKRQ